ncbi:MAG: hypothetical protein RLZZ546_3332 [Bacteroidota bacterium]|jgi:hypothetical protein
MKYELIEKFLSTLFFSWGSEAPAEATWAANDFLKILENKYNYKFKNEFYESYDDDYPNNNYEVVMEEIKQLITNNEKS